MNKALMEILKTRIKIIQFLKIDNKIINLHRKNNNKQDK